MKFLFTFYKLVGFVVVKSFIFLGYSAYMIREFKTAKYHKDKARVAVLAPGPGLINYPGSDDFDIVIAINLAAAFNDRIDHFLVERIDNTDFGQAQLSILNQRNGSVLLKNMWDRDSKRLISNLHCERVEAVIDVPLRLSQYMSVNSVCTYMRLDKFGISNWKSSMFVALSLARQLGAEETHVYGAFGENGYFWESDQGYTARYPLLKQVISQKRHPSRVGLSADEILKLVYRDEIFKGKVVLHG